MTTNANAPGAGTGDLAHGARPHDNELTPQQKKTLLTIARQTVETLIRTGRKPDFDVTDPALTKPGAAFVTLKKDGDLRGCIGHTEPRMPLWECVREMAVAAATEDPRFDRVRTDELGAIGPRDKRPVSGGARIRRERNRGRRDVDAQRSRRNCFCQCLSNGDGTGSSS